MRVSAKKLECWETCKLIKEGKEQDGHKLKLGNSAGNAGKWALTGGTSHGQWKPMFSDHAQAGLSSRGPPQRSVFTQHWLRMAHG